MDDHSLFYRQVGNRIRAKRRERGLSQEGLAKAIGLKRPSISNIEKGRQNLLLHTFCDIASTLDTTTDALVATDREPQSIRMPDLRSLPKDVREFIEAGISTNKKQV